MANLIDLLFLNFNAFYVANLLVRALGLGWTLFLKSRWNIYNLVVVGISMSLTVIVFRAEGEVLTGFLTADKVFLVLVAMNLIQAIDPLDQLFKTTAGALPALLSLIATWLVLFVTFAIAFNQIFGLTKLGANGTNNLNFRTVPKAMIVLFRMSCGEGWNDIMHDHAIAAPYCTPSSVFYDSDCGSESWAYFLFIAWNILSMYIFVNIVISLVYNNFSYVYQRAGKMSSISRAEIRGFKATWAEFDDGDGYIHKSRISRFLSKLEGAFEVRIYPREYSSKSIMERCLQHGTTGSRVRQPDLIALNAMIEELPIAEIQRRRASYRRLYTELMQVVGSERISFTSMLLTVSHNKFVDENKSLGLAEFLHRRNIRLNVDRALSEECIVSFFDSITCRRMLSNFTASNKSHQARLKVPKLVIPNVSRIRSRSPSPLSSRSSQVSWQIERGSLSPAQISENRRQSLSVSTPQELIEGLDYANLFARSVWSAAISHNPQSRDEPQNQ